MVHRLEQFYQRQEKVGRIHSNLTDLRHRNKKSTSRDSCPKGQAGSTCQSLNVQDREALKFLHRLSVGVCHPTHTQGYLKEKRYVYCTE